MQGSHIALFDNDVLVIMRMISGLALNTLISVLRGDLSILCEINVVGIHAVYKGDRAR